MKNIVFIISLIIITSCATTKNIKIGQRDGSSFETAIIVKSVSDEYAYIRKVCPDCLFLGQSLVFKKKKPYDVLEVKAPDGQEVSYYFDISKFYGKGF